MSKLNVVGILTRIAGLSVLASDVTFTQSINQLMGPDATKIIPVIALASSLAGEIIHIVQTQPSDPDSPNPTHINGELP